MSFFGLLTHMACGATYALMPFIDRKALGGVAGVIGAGCNVGAVIADFINKASPSPGQTLWLLGLVVLATALCAVSVRFSPAHKSAERALLDDAIAEREGTRPARGPLATA